jgi:hypothetical protein
MKWRYKVHNDDWTKEPYAKLTHRNLKTFIEGNLGLKGISFQPHKDCEWVNFCFDKSGTMISPACKALELDCRPVSEIGNWNWVKTQFAPVNTHIAIIKLFRHIKKSYIPNLEVRGEGEYWETENAETLISKINTIAEGMDILEKELKKMPKKPSGEESPEEFVGRLEQAFRRAINKKHGASGASS